jgi:Domain of unknown function (DUF4397)
MGVLLVAAAACERNVTENDDAGAGGSSGIDVIDGTAGAAGATGSGETGAAGAAGSGDDAGTTDGGRDTSDPDASIDADAGTTDGGADTGNPDLSTETDAPTKPAMVRFAHFLAGMAPLDFCVIGTTGPNGPLLAKAGNAGGLAYASVSQYVPLGAGIHQVKVVPAGAADCTATVAALPQWIPLPALIANGAGTVAAQGELDPGDAGGKSPSIVLYDDDTTVTAGQAKLRFVHAHSSRLLLNVGRSGGILFAPLFSNVEYGKTAQANNGYVEMAPISDKEITLRSSLSGLLPRLGPRYDLVSIENATFAANSITSLFAIGNFAGPIKILVCRDNAPPAGALTPCSVVAEKPKRGQFRIANLSPDAPAFDVCLTEAGTPFSGTPLARTISDPTTPERPPFSLSYPKITGYLSLPPQAYDVRLVLETANDCTAPAIPDKMNVGITDGIAYTIAGTGDWTLPDAGGDPAFALRIWTDSPLLNAPLIRFLHASPGTGALDLGRDYGGTSTKLFENVPFGVTPSGSGIDTNGYTPAENLVEFATLWMRAAGSSVNLAATSHPAISGVFTAFAIGNKTGDVARPLQLYLCSDSRNPPMGYPSPGEEISWCRAFPESPLPP